MFTTLVNLWYSQNQFQPSSGAWRRTSCRAPHGHEQTWAMFRCLYLFVFLDAVPQLEQTSSCDNIATPESLTHSRKVSCFLANEFARKRDTFLDTVWNVIEFVFYGRKNFNSEEPPSIVLRKTNGRQMIIKLTLEILFLEHPSSRFKELYRLVLCCSILS